MYRISVPVANMFISIPASNGSLYSSSYMLITFASKFVALVFCKNEFVILLNITSNAVTVCII